MDRVIPGGYNGKILRVNLSNNSIITEELDELFCRRYIGGAGFVTYYLWKELKAGTDALSPENKLIFALGPLSGLQLPGAARHCVGAKSPMTGGIAKSEVGGYWMVELKRAGYDAIIIEGKAPKPVYLWVKDGKAEIKDASHLWGKDTKETEETVRKELADESIQMALIGKGGENMARFACIMHGLHDAAGRGGLGAVMGSKNLKTVAVRGSKAPEIADKESVKEVRQWLIANPTPLAKFLSEFGTGGPDMIPFEASGNLPVHNFRDGVFPGVNQIHAGVMKETMNFSMDGCYACPIRCKKSVGFEDKYSTDPAYGGPEYETIAALGSNCDIVDVKAVVKGNERCTAYSLDTISTGSTIAFVMECFESGLLTTKDTGGFELKFGDADAMLKAIDMIANREGFGDIMAEGTARMAEKIGKSSEEFAMQVKGLDAGMHEPRLKPGMGYGFMLNPHGADHCWGLHDTMLESPVAMKQFEAFGIFEPVSVSETGPRKITLVRLSHMNSIIGDSLVTCSFLPYTWDIKAKALSAITGWKVGIPELIRLAERLLTLTRLFNIKHGLSAKDDVLPKRFYTPKTNGSLADTSLNEDEMNRGRLFYYSLMGWDQEGVPLPDRVEDLEIA